MAQDPVLIIAEPGSTHEGKLDRMRRMIEKWSIPEPNSGCWLWMGSLNKAGYPCPYYEGRSVRAHRLAYEAFRGPIPTGCELDHTCRVKCCVNPAHLEAVSHRENVIRGNMPGAVVLRNNRCPRGHEFTAENTYVNPASGNRRCRTCQKNYIRGYERKRRART